jgi:ADP-ribosyl-[dinitrogen reductase] hydrolase
MAKGTDSHQLRLPFSQSEQASETVVTSELDLADRGIGALLGLACGDALGAPIEFMSQTSVRERYGEVTEMMGGGVWAPGEWTDDTAMALCIAESILEYPDDPVAGAGKRFLAWAESAKDVGGTISAALRGYHACGDWVEASSTTPQARTGRAGGNGSLMRTLPVALAYADIRTMLTTSARLSAMTHWDPQAEVCCAIYNLWISQLLAGAVLDAGSWQTALDEAGEWTGQGQLAPDTAGPTPLPYGFWERLAQVPEMQYDDLQPSGFAGYCVECLEAAAWCCIHTDDLEQALVNTVNLAGEADTMGAVAGGIAGAHWGRAAIPQRWLDRLHQRRRLTMAAEQLVRLRQELEAQ